jgi:hypothetical protein
MFDKYEEHLRDSIPDNSRFDGFDRGDAEPIIAASEFTGEWEDIPFDDFDDETNPDGVDTYHAWDCEGEQS